MTAEQTFSSLESEIDPRLCPLPFIDIAHARHAGNAPLLTADAHIKTHYQPAIW